jgi:NAD(P)H-hydrate epimerase
MLKIVSTSQIREIDRLAIEEYKIPETILMENAGIAAVRHLKQTYGSLDGKKVAVFCGKGNNGGDGFVIARHLFLCGIATDVYLLADKSDVKGDARLNMEIFERMGGRLETILSDSDIEKFTAPISDADIFVDAILGTGLSSGLKGVIKTMVGKINKWEKFCLAVDIPTGLDSDRGAVYGESVNANATVTFAFPKSGMVFYPALDSIGILKAVNISFPQKLLDASPFTALLLDGAWVSGKLGVPHPSSHKGSFGHAVTCGGSPGMGGAVGLASLAALKVGAGLSTAAVISELAASFELSLPEVMSYSISDADYDQEAAKKLLAFVSGKSSLLVGPGLGGSGKRKEFVEAVITSSPVPVVLDADGLNVISGEPEVIGRAASTVVITPHPGEMGRLVNISPKEVNENRLEVAKGFTKKHRCITVLKGARTVIAIPSADGEPLAYVNPTGNPNLSSGGTGDVLAGMIAGLIARGLDPADAAPAAVYLHGIAADMFTSRWDPLSMTASDLLGHIGVAIGSLKSARQERG